MLTAEDVSTARQHLGAALGNRRKVTMIVRGTSGQIAEIARMAGIRADAFDDREAVWLRLDAADLQPVLDEHTDWFDGHDQACAVMLNFDDSVSERLNPDASGAKIEFAFMSANGD